MDPQPYEKSLLFSNSAYDFGVSVGYAGGGKGDYGPLPCIFDLPRLTRGNPTAKSTLWTGAALQLQLHRLPPGYNPGPERQLNLDRFFYICAGRGIVSMGSQPGSLQFRESVSPGCGLMVPAGTWMCLAPSGNGELVFFSLSAQAPLPGGAVSILEDLPPENRPL